MLTIRLSDFPDLMSLVQLAVVWCIEQSGALNADKREAGIELALMPSYPAKAAMKFIERAYPSEFHDHQPEALDFLPLQSETVPAGALVH